ncbi:GtrA family protein [Paenibacillus sp. FSL R7-0331]|uniref:GtrA family protein n=1 Tax=Paenibacillus sp. FSL R7-0331 TaxID=1536773 RepID=UPI0004F5BCDA|nr:GtrA family protein [Paenibacillus sp. FSL R7-0331]AIQ55093.1 hypothetical protein R70331_28810 [Paenibacillus sp. FSL R7-0331]
MERKASFLSSLLKQETIKFLVVGVLNTLVGYGFFYICYTVAEWSYPLSLVISHIIGVVNSFLWNSKWTFNTAEIKLSRVLKFCLVYLVTLFLNLATLSFFVEWVGVEVLIAQLLSLFITTAVSFFGHKYWSFNKGRIIK